MAEFRTEFGERIFQQKYALFPGETWGQRARTVAGDVCGGVLKPDVIRAIGEAIANFEFIPGGRYLYYGGRPARFYNNCMLFRLEHDTREEWADLAQRVMAALLTGAGIGVDYSIARPKDAPLRRTGGRASGPIALVEAINEIGRRVKQGGSRRSAMYASLDWRHADAEAFVHAKDWANMPVGQTGFTVAQLKEQDFNYHAPLDMTNISLNYDDHFLARVHRGELPELFLDNVRQAFSTAEPGFSFNHGSQANETLRNACTEVTSEDDSDICNLGSVNMSRIESKERFRQVVELATMFLMAGTVTADLPSAKARKVREKNRRLGLGLMGVHEWLLVRGHRYEVVPELHDWLRVYRDESTATAKRTANALSLSVPVATRAIAPTGTIGILAGTTTGIEPLFAVAYKRRFLFGDTWMAQHVVDGTARHLIQEFGVRPDHIETALTLADDVERRIAFQADVQDYVDQAISSTINLPAWGSDLNNEDKVIDNARIIAKYAHRLRGLTCYPDGARGGQPLTVVPYEEALAMGDEARIENVDICVLSGKGGTCGE